MLTDVDRVTGTCGSGVDVHKELLCFVSRVLAFWYNLVFVLVIPPIRILNGSC